MEAQVEKKALPKKVAAGYALINIGSTLLLIMTTLLTVLIVLAFTVAFDELDFTNPETIADLVFDFVIALFYIAAAIAGYNYTAHRSFLVWMVGVAAIVFFVIFIYQSIDFGMRIYQQGFEPFYLVEIGGTILTQTIYFIGWWISKDYFED